MQELAAIVCAVVVDGYKFQNAFFRRPPSANVQASLSFLETTRGELLAAQMDAGIEFPVSLSGDAGGLVETWASGVSWRELCKDTSLDQGDVCRILRRTVEALRQIPPAFGVGPELAQTAAAAADKMDRFPVADFGTEIAGGERSAGAEGRAGRGFAPGVGEAVEEVEASGAEWLVDFDGDDEPADEERDLEDGDGVDARDGSRRGLFPWTAKGLKGNRNALEEIDLVGSLDLDKLLGLGMGGVEEEEAGEAEEAVTPQVEIIEPLE